MDPPEPSIQWQKKYLSINIFRERRELLQSRYVRLAQVLSEDITVNSTIFSKYKQQSWRQ